MTTLISRLRRKTSTYVPKIFIHIITYPIYKYAWFCYVRLDSLPPRRSWDMLLYIALTYSAKIAIIEIGILQLIYSTINYYVNRYSL